MSLPCDFCRDHLLFIGMDCRRNWVVWDQAGLCGGLFVNRSKALRLGRPRKPQMISSHRPTTKARLHGRRTRLTTPQIPVLHGGKAAFAVAALYLKACASL